MRRIGILAAALIVGCASDGLVPARVPATASVTFSNTAGDTSVTPTGDGVIATATFTYGCSGDVRAWAGRESGRLVVTISDSLPGPVPCAYLAGYKTYRSAVGPLPSGSYAVELRFRDVVGRSVTTSTLRRTTVAVP